MISYEEIKASYPIEKKSVESLYGKIIPVRKISFWVTLPFLKLNVSAWSVSILSIIVAILACTMISINSPVCRIIGVFLVPCWHLLDCVDGNIARIKKTSSKLGEFVDAASGYFFMSLFPMALGIAAYNTTALFETLNPIYFIFMGALASISETLCRLIHQKYAYTLAIVEKKNDLKLDKGDEQYHLKGFHKFRKMIGVEFGPVGIMMFALWLSPFFNLFDLLTIYYFCFYVVSLVIASFYYLSKGKIV